MHLLGILIGSSHCLPLLGLVRVTTLELVLRKTTFIKLLSHVAAVTRYNVTWLDAQVKLNQKS